MKKIYLALTCMASLMMMTACGGDKKTDAADNENENTEVVDETEEQNEEEAGEEAKANPADAKALDLKAIYDLFLDAQDMWNYWLSQNPNIAR